MEPTAQPLDPVAEMHRIKALNRGPKTLPLHVEIAVWTILASPLIAVAVWWFIM
jgi:hypothetical protein